jgi:hypothetical protein
VVAGEPPILADARGKGLAQRQPGGVVVGTAAEGQQAEGAEQEGQGQGVARPRLGMGQAGIHRLRAAACDGMGQQGDVGALALRAASRDQGRRTGDAVAGRGALGHRGMGAGAGGVGQGEVRVRRDRGIEPLARPRTGGQQAVHPLAIGGGGLAGSGAQRQGTAVVLGHGVPLFRHRG